MAELAMTVVPFEMSKTSEFETGMLGDAVITMSAEAKLGDRAITKTTSKDRITMLLLKCTVCTSAFVDWGRRPSH